MSREARPERPEARRERAGGERAKDEGQPTSGSPSVVHADGTLTLEDGVVRVEVTRGGGYRGMLEVPVGRCRVRVMGRAVVVLDGETVVHLCSRCKPTAEVARLTAALGDRAVVERRTPFSELLALREASAAYEPPGSESKAGADAEAPEGGDAAIPDGFESLRRVYVSQAVMDRDARRMRAAGWVAHETSGAEALPDKAAAEPRPSRFRGLVRAASPQRDVSERVVVWVRPLDREPAGTS